jgi:hypothetical protein
MKKGREGNSLDVADRYTGRQIHTYTIEIN